MRLWSQRVVREQRKQRVPLLLEVLEDRSLLSASGLLDPDYILVQFKNDSAVQKVLLDDGLTVEQALAAYRSQDSVAFAEQDYQVSVSVLPNDSSFGSLYGLNNTGQSAGTVDADIDAPEAWDITQGSIKTVVAIIDTGIDYAHPDLYLNIWINQGEIPTAIRNALLDFDGDGLITFRDLNDTRNQGAGKITDLNANGYIDGGDLLKSRALGGWADSTSNDGDGYVDDIVGWDFANNDNDPFDDNGHGTHVAGTIGAIGNNGVGVAGVNWNVQMAGLKFLAASGSGATSGAAAALDYAVAKGIKISNNSWGGGGYSQSFYNSLLAARNAGHIFVAAAGNAGANNDATANYPSNYNLDNVIAVAATDRNDNLASFSNYGATTVDLAAPGVSITSTYPGNRYASLSGTSMATPHVAGVVALVKSLKPDYTYTQIISQVVNNTDVKVNLSGKVATSGRLNAYKAIANLTADTTGARVLSVTPNATGINPVSSVRVTFNEAINTATFTTGDITSFSGPQGALTVTGVQVVAGSGNKQFDILFNTQSSAGTYRLSIGPDVRDLSNNLMDQDADGLRGEVPDDLFAAQFVISAPSTYTFSSQPNLTIRDRATVTASITINQDITVADLNVQLNLTHTYDNDLYITLVSPTGQTVVLFNRRGGSGDNLTNTIFDDEASTLIANGAAPFAGTFRPDGVLSTFDGRNARGTWQLRINDMAAYDTGKLTFWSLTFQGGSAAASQSIGEAEVTEAETHSSASAGASEQASEPESGAAAPFLVGTTPATERVLSSEQPTVLGRFARLFSYSHASAEWLTAVRQLQAAGTVGGSNAAGEPEAIHNLMSCFELHDEWEALLAPTLE